MLPGCIVLANNAFDPLPIDQQQEARAAVARFLIRWNEVTVGLDRALVDGLFAKQGLQRIEVTPQLRAEFFAAAHTARAALGDSVLSRELVRKLETLLQEYRAELLHSH